MGRLIVEILKRLTDHGRSFHLDVDFQSEALTTVIFGPSGAGKTSLLRAVAGLIQPDRGRIQWNDRVFFDSGRAVMLPPFRRHLGMVFQQPSLFPHLSAFDNVLFASAVPDRREAARLLERFHVSHTARQKPLQLSGGEQQRVAIARALAARPRLLLLDEPLPGVDAVTRASVLKDLVEYQKENEVPYLYVTHNRVEALRLGGRALLMDEGRIVARGPAEEVLTSPMSTEAARVLGTDNVLAGMLVSHHREEGLSEIDLGGVVLYAAATSLPAGTPVAATIPSTDIIVSVGEPLRTSARNVLPGRVSRIFDANAIIEVIVETPVPFRAHISRSALESLGLRPGTAVHLLMKAIAILVDPI